MADEVDPNKLEIADELIAERRSAAPGQLPDDMHPAHRAIIGFIDTFNEYVGKIVCWMLVPLCVAMVYEVVARKIGIDPTIWLSELIRWISRSDEPSQIIPKPTSWAYDVSRMLYGAMFMLGAAYALSKGVHIRADFIYRYWSDRTQGIIDLILYCTLFMFGMAGLIYSGSEYFWSSVSQDDFKETLAKFSENPDFFSNGWPYRLEEANDTSWAPYLWPVRLCIPVGAAFLMLQGLSEILKSWYASTRGRWPV